MKTHFLYITVILICTASVVFTSCAGNADNTILPGTSSSDFSPTADSLTPNDAQTGLDVPGEVAGSKEYAGWVGAYLDILAENKLEISSPNVDDDGVIAMLDVFGDETPELIYIYRHNDLDFSDVSALPGWAMKIFSYSEPGGAELVFNTTVFFAIGGGNNYCVYLTREGELMIYRSDFSGGSVGWGFWQIVPNQSLKTKEESLVDSYDSDLAKLYYEMLTPEKGACYKKDGKVISKEQYDKTAKEIMGDIERVIFQGAGRQGHMLYDSGFDELWNSIKPFNENCMTYDEAIAWLEAQGDGQEQK